MRTNLYIVRHGKVNLDEKNKTDYLHLSREGIEFSGFLDKHFKDVYLDHIFFQTADIAKSDPYNQCYHTVKGMKGVKTAFDKTQVSMVFRVLNDESSDVRNMLLCFRADGFNVISNIISPQSEEEFSKDYHRVFHYTFESNNYDFVRKFSAEEVVPG